MARSARAKDGIPELNHELIPEATYLLPFSPMPGSMDTVVVTYGSIREAIDRVLGGISMPVLAFWRLMCSLLGTWLGWPWCSDERSARVLVSTLIFGLSLKSWPDRSKR